MRGLGPSDASAAPASTASVGLPLRSTAWLLGAFVSSGIAALGLELIWVRILGLALGSERLGMLAVLAAFFSGVALGSAALHGLIIRSRHPANIYLVAECPTAADPLVP